jgi:hypothetical protein
MRGERLTKVGFLLKRWFEIFPRNALEATAIKMAIGKTSSIFWISAAKKRRRMPTEYSSVVGQIVYRIRCI